MKIKKFKIALIFILFALIIMQKVIANEYPLNTDIEPMIKNREHNYKEADYVNAYCKGQIEYVLDDLTRIDCLTEDYAIEFDWAKKWAESVGQSMYYAEMTNKLPAVAIIMKSPRDERFIKRINIANEDIVIFRIKAY